MLEFRKIGLTGGVASGKSAVAELLAAAGIPVINLDEIGRELTNGDRPLQVRLGRVLGGTVYQDGVFNRARARDMLFSDSDKRRAVEAILHPMIADEFERQASKAKAEGHKLVICEAALLMEAGMDKILDGIILVSAPEGIRSTRVVERDRIGAALAEQMIRSQMKDVDRPKERTTISIENNGSLADLSLKVNEVLADWKTSGWI